MHFCRNKSKQKRNTLLHLFDRYLQSSIALNYSINYGSKIVMLVHISPSEEDISETICSLSFAKRTRSVESSKDITEELKKRREKKVVELEGGMREAEYKNHKVRDQIEQLQLRLNENRMLYSSKYELQLRLNENRMLLELLLTELLLGSL